MNKICCLLLILTNVPEPMTDFEKVSDDLGIVGEIHPQVLTNFGLIMPTVGLEMEVGRVVLH